MKTETKTNKSVRLLSLLTMIVVLISGLGMISKVNAAGKPSASQININSAVHGSTRYYVVGDKLQVSGKIHNVTAGSIKLAVEIRVSQYGPAIKRFEDELSYVKGPDVDVSEFTVNQLLSKYSLPEGAYVCAIIVANKPVGASSYNYDFKYINFTVIATNTNEYRFVARLAEQFVMTKGWTCYNTIQLKARNRRASVIAKEAVDSYLTRYPNCSPETFVRKLYRGILGREPDAEGFNYWVSAIKAGMPKSDVAKWWTSVQNVELIEHLRRYSLWNH